MPRGTQWLSSRALVLCSTVFQDIINSEWAEDKTISNYFSGKFTWQKGAQLLTALPFQSFRIEFSVDSSEEKAEWLPRKRKTMNSNLCYTPQCSIFTHSVRSLRHGHCPQSAYTLIKQIQVNTSEMQHQKLHAQVHGTDAICFKSPRRWRPRSPLPEHQKEMEEWLWNLEKSRVQIQLCHLLPVWSWGNY